MTEQMITHGVARCSQSDPFSHATMASRPAQPDVLLRMCAALSYNAPAFGTNFYAGGFFHNGTGKRSGER